MDQMRRMHLTGHLKQMRSNQRILNMNFAQLLTENNSFPWRLDIFVGIPSSQLAMALPKQQLRYARKVCMKCTHFV